MIVLLLQLALADLRYELVQTGTESYTATSHHAVVDGVEQVSWEKASFNQEELNTEGVTQTLALTPGFQNPMPESLADIRLAGPVTDLLTLYHHARLALDGELDLTREHTTWDHLHPMLVNSGVCFELRGHRMRRRGHLHIYYFEHLAPLERCMDYPSPWMSTPASAEAPNNWVNVMALGPGNILAQVGVEALTTLFTVDTSKRRIVEASMTNEVLHHMAFCKDQDLTQCSKPQKSEIFRKVEMTLLPDSN